MESGLRNGWQLSSSQYAKSSFRARQSSLSYPEKVRQVVALQHRIVPVCAKRGRLIVPWKIDREEAGL